MVRRRVVVMVVLVLVSMIWFIVEGDEGEGGGLSFNFYEISCPQVESIVRVGIAPLFIKDPTSPASLLRLMFHDCQVQGCDASILLDSEDNEMGSAKNFGIHHRETVGIIKSMVEAECPGQVSCADILILSAREAIAMSGGPLIRVPLGRKDSATTTTMSYKLADASLPASNIGVDAMLHIFSTKGMTIQESVAILGAHTLGITHCLNIVDRLDRTSTNNSQEMEPGFRAFLKLSCPMGSLASYSTFVANDLTAIIFDNQYYRDAVGGRGVLRIDAEMSIDPRTAPIMVGFALDQDEFFQAFTSAFVKLSLSGILTGNQGVVRTRCNVLD